jgi:hypothetical protein
VCAHTVVVTAAGAPYRSLVEWRHCHREDAKRCGGVEVQSKDWVQHCRAC